VVTGHAGPSWRERAEQEGCAGFLVKPCLPDELATELRHVLDRTMVSVPRMRTSLERRAPDVLTPTLLECGEMMSATIGERISLAFRVKPDQ
jgi:DNA-binding NarL/FixJ family response regulator